MIRVIHAEPDFLVLDKPAGISVHPARTAGGRGASARDDTLVDWLVKKYPEVKRVGDDPVLRPGIVHRLDKDTSGVMLAARNQETFEVLKQLFKERGVEKTYLALVVGAPKRSSGTIDVPIGRQTANRTKRGVGARTIGSRRAITRYTLLERIGPYSLLRVRPETGRTHQIRVHLASISLPVAGDTVYGGQRAAIPGLTRQFLHAWKMAFSFPQGRRWQFESALPEDLDRALKRLRRLRKAA